MTITKFGHCCLLLEVEGKRILIDPGRFSETQNSLTDIDIILISHEHADHCHSESISELLTNNPDAVVVTNTSVATLLQSLGVAAYILEHRDSATIVDVNIEAFDGKHAEIFEAFGMVQNTGYLVAERFFFPGDAYTVPNKTIAVLALPVAGPWCKVSEAIAYALQVRPTVAFPVHDATLSEIGRAVTYPHFERELSASGTRFVVLEGEQEYEF